MALPKRKTDIGPPNYEKFLPPVVKKNYGKWAYHEILKPGIMVHVAESGDKLFTVRAATPRLASIQSIRAFADLADKYCDGHLRYTSRNNIEFLTTEEANVEPIKKELEELDREGHLGDLAVDEIDRMTATELRRRVRRHKADRDKLADEVHKKDTIIDLLHEENKDLREGKIYTASEKKLILEVDKAIPQFMSTLGQLEHLDRFKTAKVAFQAEAVLAVFRQATIGPGLLVGTALLLWST